MFKNSGSDNVGVGWKAMADNVTGASNVAIGSGGGQGMKGGQNVAIGFRTVYYGSTATNNVAVGYAACQAVGNSGSNNVGIGHSAITLAEAPYNTAVGSLAGDTITTGTNNIMLGFHSEASAVDVTYEIVIGSGVDTSNAFAGAGTETCRIGRASDYITCDFGENATWTHSSDVRIKKDIEDSQLGLSFINDLRPVTYKKKAPSEYPEEFSGHDAEQTERKNPDKKHYGFIAQEVKEVMDKAGHSEFPVWKENPDGMQELGEVEFITPLIKAVQELSAQVDILKAELSALKGE
jgi:hypothetical protein